LTLDNGTHRFSRNVCKELTFYVISQNIADLISIFEHDILNFIIFGPKRDDIIGERRKLHDEELSDLCFSLDIVRMIKSKIMRWVVHVVQLGEESGVYRGLVGKPEGKRPPRSPCIYS
jgi:hypothetical protein